MKEIVSKTHNEHMAPKSSKEPIIQQLIFTEPWEPVITRRGDPLGVRPLVDQIAEAVAPGFSNRTQDARWVTLLAWSLVRSHAVYRTGLQNTELNSSDLRQRYAWLRPLELQWVARTITLDEDGWRSRGLPGRRSVSAAMRVDSRKMPLRFGMTPAQYQRYRQTGAYGAYRVAFRKWEGLTQGGDGWTPATACIKLASWLDAKLGPTVRPGWSLNGDSESTALSSRSIRAHVAKEDQWWIANWPNYLTPSRSRSEELLPSFRNEVSKLPEATLLEPLVFGLDPSGQRRRKVVREMSRAVTDSHQGCCEALAIAFSDVPAIALMPQLLALTDAAMDVMDRIAEKLIGGSGASILKIQTDRECKRRMAMLVSASNQWMSHKECRLSHTERADRLATAILTAQPIDRFRALIQHHQSHGGGLRWFTLQGDSVVPNAPPLGITSRYGFRLWALSRIAVQCGVSKRMPKGLVQETADLDDEALDE
jgi:hypothetical protein